MSTFQIGVIMKTIKILFLVLGFTVISFGAWEATGRVNSVFVGDYTNCYYGTGSDVLFTVNGQQFIFATSHPSAGFWLTQLLESKRHGYTINVEAEGKTGEIRKVFKMWML